MRKHSFGGFNERGDSFEPHLFYFLDLSQKETCCVLIPAGTIISYLIAFERLFRTKQTKKEQVCETHNIKITAACLPRLFVHHSY